MESTRTITVVCTVLELGPFKQLMEETVFSETNCYLKCLNRGRDYSAFTHYRAMHFSVSWFYLLLDAQAETDMC